MRVFKNPEVEQTFDAYPKHVQSLLLSLRQLVFEAAGELDSKPPVEETLKWGEPAYVTKYGSTIRMDWKERNPDHYAMYFQCTSRLVPTFREVYGNEFSFEGNRAIIFKLTDEVPVAELKHCIALALTYHKVKHLPMLGI